MDRFSYITCTQLDESFFYKEYSTNWEQVVCRTVPIQSVDTPDSSVLDSLDSSKLLSDTQATVKKEQSNIEAIKALYMHVRVFLFKCQGLCENIFIIFKRLKALARRFSKCLLKHNLPSKVIPKKTGLGLYGMDSDFNLN